MENATQFKNRKTALLNEKLEEALEEHDLQIDALQNASSSQKQQLKELQNEVKENNIENDNITNECNKV